MLISSVLAPYGSDPSKALPPVNGDPPPLNVSGSASRTPTPEAYIDQTTDWFKAGRFFKIWALEDMEIHEKIFILLDSKNKEGQGVLVLTLDKDRLK